MNTDKLYRRWNNRLAKLQKELKQEWKLCRRTGEEESIHRLRVLLRRLRLYLGLGRPALGRAEVERFRSWSREMSDAVGLVRDCDVAIAWTREQPAAEAVCARLIERRGRLWNQARPKLKRRLDVPRRARSRGRRKGQPAKRLFNRFARLFENALREILGFRFHLDPADLEHWHEFRRDLRRLRYLRELWLPFRAHKQDALLRKLLHLQDLLGEAQNCVAMAAVISKGRPSSELARLCAELDVQRKQWLEQSEAALLAFQNSRKMKAALK